MYAFIFMGRSGCGKGTQVALLTKYLQSLSSAPVLHIETGARFRDFIKGNNFSNIRSKELYENDDLQPSFLGCLMWSEAVIESVTGNENIIFDGVARTLEEARVLESALQFLKLDKFFVINLDVSRAWSEKHLLARGRSDDANLTKINKRLDWFEKDTMPALEYYKNSPLYNFVAINGEQSVESVGRDIVAYVKPLLS